MSTFLKLRTKIEKILQLPAEDGDLYFNNTKIPVTLAAKEYLLQVGDICTNLAFVEKGELRMFYVTEEGKEINIEFFFENDFVTSYQSYIQQKPSKYYLQANTPCE